MRRKKHIDERLEKCSDMLHIYESDVRDYSLSDPDVKQLDLKQLFPNGGKIELEVGCGKGGFITELARRNPDVNYIAVEKCDNVIVLACEKAREMGLKNIFFVSTYAEYLLRLLPENSIDNIYLNFSCPFPKSGQAVHRLTHSRFLDIYAKLLKNGGEICQKTDSMKLFEFSLEQFSSCGWLIKNVSLDLHNSRFNENNIETEYEHKFSEQGFPIYRLEAAPRG